MSETEESFDALIVGNGVAGFACAGALARRGLRPLLIGPGLPFDRPPLSKAALAAGDAQPQADESALEARGIARLDGTVTASDFGAGRLVVTVADGQRELTAPAIVMAVGLDYDPLPIPGLPESHVNATPEGLARLSAALGKGSGNKDIVVIGAGLVGVETAATLAGIGHRVTLGDIEQRPLHRLHDPLPAVAAAALESARVRFVGEMVVTAVVHDRDSGATVETAGHGAIRADIVIAATGTRQRQLPWVSSAPHAVDAEMRVAGYNGVFAIGDCAVPPHARFGRLHLPHWDVAIGTADVAAAAIAGEPTSYDRLPYWWTDIGDHRVAEVGVAELAVQWSDDGVLHVGRDENGDVVCCTVVGEPRRLREARAMLLAAA